MSAPGNNAPLTLTDDLGFRVELKSPPRRIISLVPSWTETLFAMGLGDCVVGVTKFCVRATDSNGSAEAVPGLFGGGESPGRDGGISRCESSLNEAEIRVSTAPPGLDLSFAGGAERSA